ncbi:hypothetical protein HMPREF1990_01920 [Porphyromonas gingivalis W4087]|uniref:Uncharacterized protein n=1 Tax=Porphyromonas gingivalis F0570 TaxID=1227271 RepID=A0A0E2LS35_PORGN|nr:hypothetical protein HMPREF1555_00685 [Porphyromonas gingivalis F0570]ERJ86977.1 hypothetical protein HMPREF1990_01920 [Porphyromonas gingivalis W4087]
MEFYCPLFDSLLFFVMISFLQMKQIFRFYKADNLDFFGDSFLLGFCSLAFYATL